MSISDKLQTLINGKTELVNTINKKVGTALTVSSPWSDLKDSINSLGSGGSEDRLKKLLDTTKSARYLFFGYKGTSVDDLIKYGDTSNVTDMGSMFNSCSNLTSIPLLETSNVTNMSYMFSECSKLRSIPQLDTSNVTNMASMFSYSQLTSMPQLDTSNVTNMSSMFINCPIQTIPLLNTTNVTDVGSMFHGCYNLITISLLNTSNITKMTYTFGSCSSLTKVIIHNSTNIPPLSANSFNGCFHFFGTVSPAYNPEGLKDGRIYVPDDMVESFKTATNWSVFADQILPLSELPEEE